MIKYDFAVFSNFDLIKNIFQIIYVKNNFFQIIFIDLILAGDNAIVIGMVASQYDHKLRKKIIFWGIGVAIVIRIIYTLITAYLLQINGLKAIGGLLLLYIAYKLYNDVIKNTTSDDPKKIGRAHV